MKLEDRLVQKYGLTDDPILALWILRDGRVVNGSHEGKQRDIDHRDIGELFKPSVFEQRAKKTGPYGSGTVYMDKFMRRGNIRCGGSECGFCAEIMGKPSVPALQTMSRYMHMAIDAGVETCVTYWVHNASTRNANRFRRVTTDFLGYLEHLESYSPALYESLR